jgi:hypothetical protein
MKNFIALLASRRLMDFGQLGLVVESWRLELPPH